MIDSAPHPLDLPSSVRRSSGQSTRATRILMAMVALIYLAVAVGASVHDRLTTRRERERRLYASVDNILLRSCQNARSIYLLFEGLSGRDLGYVTTLYFRAVYLLFPTRVLVGDPAAVLFDLDQMIRANQVPSDAWLADHNVDVLLTIRLERGMLLMPARDLPRNAHPAPTSTAEIISTKPRHDP